MLNNDIMGYWMILLAGFIFGKNNSEWAENGGT